MRAILVDPIARTVSEVEHNGDYRHIYELIGCETFTVVGIEHGDAIYIDDEGLLTDDPRYYFMYYGYNQPLAGKGLILGTNREGDSVAPASSLEEIKDKVSFVELKLEGFEDYSGTIDHPILGPNTPLIGNRPIFSKRSD